MSGAKPPKSQLDLRHGA